MRLILSAAVFFAAIGCLAPDATRAQEGDAPAAPAPASPTIESLLADLDDESFAVREAASTALMLHADLDDTRLAKAMRAAKRPEQKQRLIVIVMHRFFARLAPQKGDGGGAMGCIGIDISQLNLVRPDQHPELEHTGLLVTRTRVGFPAFAQMRPGDIVLSFQGKRFGEHLEDHQAFVAAIQEHRAGDTIKMTVMRSGKVVDIDLKLDHLIRLQQVQQMLPSPDYPELYDPWRKHLKNMLGEEPAPKPIRIVPPPDAPGKPRAPADEADTSEGTTS